MQQVTAIEPYPAGSRILHIGPPKTGTTAVQSSLFVRQAELAAYGVAYPGRRRHERAAVSAVALEWSPPGFRGDLDRDWRWLTHEVLASPADRVVVSSELFAVAPDARLPRIVGDLGGGPGGDLKVVITIRPPARMLPSQWQELVQNLETLDYEAWLRRLFASDTAPETESLWRQTRVDRLVRRWGAQVGEENVTVIVLDPADRSMLLDTFERLLGLPAGFLVPADDQDNLSLPYPEVEMLRLFNRRFREEGLDPDLHVRAIRRRALRQVKSTGRPVMEAHPIGTPPWAVEQANAVAAEMADAIRASGARVIGDLDHLLTPVDEREQGAAPTQVSVVSAAEVAYGMFVGGRGSARKQARTPKQRDARPALDDLSTGDLARALLGRAWARLRPGR